MFRAGETPALQIRPMSQFVFACEPGWEARLIEELQQEFPDSRRERIAAGWVASEIADNRIGDSPCIALCNQCLPLAEAVFAKSISEWSMVAAGRIIAGLVEHDAPWRLHVFGVYRSDGPVGRRRCELIRESILSHLRKKQRRLLRTLSADDGPWQADEAFVQVALIKPASGFFSLIDPRERFQYRRLLAPFCGGIAEVPPDKRAPSRAFAKLLEAEMRLGRRIEPGETCVDLGSSPGSWAYVVVNRGASVVAVDRSPLRADLMASPAVEFVRGDAFGYRPPKSVDWLLCDVIAPPQRIIELLQTWVARRWCRRFCVTVKFRGAADYPLLQPLKQWLGGEKVEFILRRLTNNKNEVTVAGELSKR